MSLEQQISNLVASTTNLTDTVTALVPTWQGVVDQLGIDVAAFIQQAAAMRPLSPNLLADTKKFRGLCSGQLNTVQPWDAGGIGAPWWGAWHQGAAGTLDIEVVFAGDELRLGQLGLWPLGELEQLVRHYPNDEGYVDWGVDSNIVILDFTVTDAVTTHDGNVVFTLGQSTTPQTSWFLGQFKTQTSLFLNVMEVTGDIVFSPIHDRTWISPGFGAAQLGQGWKHYAGSRDGFGGFDHSYVIAPTQTPGHLKVAMALPYSGFGDHQGLPVWTASMGYWDRDDADHLQPELG